MKKNIIIVLITIGILVGIWFITSASKPETNASNAITSNTPQKITFNGEKGTTLILADNQVKVDAATLDDNQAKFYNVQMPNGKIIYFFVVKDENGVYRSAANACEVCFKTYKGFRQEGDEIICNNCGTRYPLEKIGTEKGGCNPGPISPNLSVKENQVIINQADLEQVLNLF